MENEYSEAGEGFPYPLGSVRDILTALFKHKTKVLTVFLLVFGIVAGYVFSMITLYEARTSLLLKMGREHIFRPEVGKESQIVEYNEDAAIQSEIEIISSIDLIRRVVSTLGVEKVYPEFLDPSLEIKNPLEKSVATFSKNLLTIPVKNSSVLEISYLNPRPAVAAEALNLLVDLLKEKHLQVFSDPKASFLTKQLKDYQEKLERSEEILQEFKHKHDLSSPLSNNNAVSWISGPS